MRDFANTTVSGLPEYGLKVSTMLYSISGPTHNAVFDGNVQGVVVQARKYALPCPCISAMGSVIRNWATQVVSFTSR